MTIPRKLVAAAVFSAALAAQGSKQAPRFEVDLLWPKPLPNHQLLGSATGVAVDAQDHVFVVHRTDSFAARTEIGADTTPPIGECCRTAPPVLEFDPAGNLVNAWGGPGPGYEWPAIPGGIAIDPKGNVWIAGGGGLDGQILEFTHDGKFIKQVGKASTAPAPAAARGDSAYQGVSPGARSGGRGGRGRGGAPAPTLPPNSNSTEMFGGAAKIAFDPNGSDAFVADGYRNHRVAVVDAAAGKITRFFGANGSKPDDAPLPAYSPDAPPAPQFSTVRCAEPSKDGLLYVCDRANDRIQVFRMDGSFVKEGKVAPKTLGEGSVCDIAFSRDDRQRYLYVADGLNNKVHILDRVNLAELTAFGDGGRVPGTFYAVQSLAVDSKGNLYTAETYEGKRVQRFTYRGMGPVTKADQGVLWPTRAGR